jgi:hypothetical protein
MPKTITLNEDQVIHLITDFLSKCDGDDLAHIAEIVSGIPCSAVDGYEFMVNDQDTTVLEKYT